MYHHEIPIAISTGPADLRRTMRQLESDSLAAQLEKCVTRVSCPEWTNRLLARASYKSPDA
jgi:hypothetical protein